MGTGAWPPDGTQAAVLSWWAGARHERDRLPWRATRDPWLTLMAEVMLAQTQAARVAARFATMAGRFPTPAAMASAPLDEVLARWVGLGYNRRAVALYRCAQLVVERHGGAVPEELDGLLALPGVGPYTARAVLAFAHGRPVGAVDTNIGRVLARAFAGRALARAEAQRLADRLVPARRARAWNLALMDLGSLVCRAREPLCASCALAAGHCAWRAADPDAVVDPARSSAGVTGRQSRFSGSDREGRGRLVAAAAAGALAEGELPLAAGWPGEPDRAHRVAEGLVADGLLERAPDGGYRLARVG